MGEVDTTEGPGPVAPYARGKVPWMATGDVSFPGAAGRNRWQADSCTACRSGGPRLDVVQRAYFYFKIMYLV